MKQASCQTCGAVFYRRNYEITSNRAKYCSIGCKAEHQRGKKQSKETISKKIVSMTGKKRKPLTEEIKNKIRSKLIGRRLPREVVEKVRAKLLGRRLSDKARKNIGLCKLKEKNPNWKGGIDRDKRGMKTAEYKAWRYDVFCRDWFACQMPGCNEPENYLEAHHIKTYNDYPELKLEISNGITLCKECHRRIRHKEKIFEKLFTEIIKLNL